MGAPSSETLSLDVVRTPLFDVGVLRCSATLPLDVFRFVLTWIGSLAENGATGAGQLYRRNRYYDPASGRFTQEDNSRKPSSRIVERTRQTPTSKAALRE